MIFIALNINTIIIKMFSLLKYIAILFILLYFVGSSLVTIESAAELSFLSYRVEPLQSKTNFWIGLYRNVEGNFSAMIFES